MPALLLAALGFATGRADGPGDNEPGSVRPVPPPGIALPQADRADLEAGLAALGRDIEALGARSEAVPLLPDVEIYRTAVRTAVVHDEFFTAEDIAEARTLLATGRERARVLATGQTPWLARPGPTALGYVSNLNAPTSAQMTSMADVINQDHLDVVGVGPDTFDEPEFYAAIINYIASFE